ncbi:molybdenum cofactor guanylyltransferase [Phosphitispora sp. TUW77]|uniref:molybdenum cofactor guanylyltransferase n=1 Tax=Phosphitispora sp. TUW77 TaxID=3152361 RepID=UPI003AB1BCBD
MLEATAVVLAGGKSTRMGRDKALIRVTENRMLEGVVKVLAPEFPEIIISSNASSHNIPGTRIIPDTVFGQGPLGGIYTCLKDSGHQVNFVVACDMPFIESRLAVHLVSLAPGYDAVIPRMGGHYQPLFAVYTKKCLPAIETSLNNGRNRIVSFYSKINSRFVGPDEIRQFGDLDMMFFNVNTPGDLNIAQKMALHAPQITVQEEADE